MNDFATDERKLHCFQDMQTGSGLVGSEPQGDAIAAEFHCAIKRKWDLETTPETRECFADRRLSFDLQVHLMPLIKS